MATMVMAAVVHAADTKRPNIVFIFADDMGYGEVQYLNPKFFEKGGHGMGGCDWITPATQWLREQKIITIQ